MDPEKRCEPTVQLPRNGVWLGRRLGSRLGCMVHVRGLGTDGRSRHAGQTCSQDAHATRDHVHDCDGHDPLAAVPRS